MNEIARSGAAPPLPAFFQLPPISSTALHFAIEDLTKPHPDIIPPKQFSEGLQGAAVGAMAAISDLLPPAPTNILAAWLWPVADAVEWTPAEDEFFRRVAALALAAVNLPHVAWTLDTQREMIATAGKRLPSVGQILGVVEPTVAALRLRAAALRTILAIETG